MRIPRVYHQAKLIIGDVITLNSIASHHLVTVLRLALGDPVIVFNGEGGEYAGKITEIKKRLVDVQIESFNDINHESPLNIHLGQVISRGDRMDTTLQKAVELGVSEITPLMSERCEVKLTAARLTKKLQHWQNIIVHACEQSGRTCVPKLHQLVNLTNWLTDCHADIKYILHPGAQPLNKQLSDVSSVAIAVGPEGGFTNNELQLAKHANFTSVQLGPRILRTETAAMVAISVLQSISGDL